jgi:hypothetical protein
MVTDFQRVLMSFAPSSRVGKRLPFIWNQIGYDRDSYADLWTVISELNQLVTGKANQV